MKKVVSVVTVLISSFIIVACSSGEVQPSNSGGEAQRSNSGFLLYEDKVTLSDGRVVTCVTFSGVNKGGVSCDW